MKAASSTLLSGAVIAATALAILGPSFTSSHAAAATAGGANCSATIEKLVTYPLDDRYRVAISCKHIDGSVKVRGVAAFALRPDKHTAWFTDTGKTYYSDWGTPLFGITPDAKVEIVEI